MLAVWKSIEVNPGSFKAARKKRQLRVKVLGSGADIPVIGRSGCGFGNNAKSPGLRASPLELDPYAPELQNFDGRSTKRHTGWQKVAGCVSHAPVHICVSGVNLLISNRNDDETVDGMLGSFAVAQNLLRFAVKPAGDRKNYSIKHN
jgi:hypothetical protein